jgi:hypothetical protein
MNAACLKLAAAVACGLAIAACGSSHHEPAASSLPVSTTSQAPDPLRYMPGDGVWQKYWGVWESEPAPTDCFWSVVAKDPYAPAETLDHGTAAPGETVRVDIEPVGDRNVMFQTHGCGAWRLVD